MKNPVTLTHVYYDSEIYVQKYLYGLYRQKSLKFYVIPIFIDFKKRHPKKE